MGELARARKYDQVTDSRRPLHKSPAGTLARQRNAAVEEV